MSCNFFFLIFILLLCSLQPTYMSRGAWRNQKQMTIVTFLDVRLRHVTETGAITDGDLISAFWGRNSIIASVEIDYHYLSFWWKKKKEITQSVATSTNKQNKSRQLRPFVAFYWKDTVQLLCEWHHSLVSLQPVFTLLPCRGVRNTHQWCYVNIVHASKAVHSKL